MPTLICIIISILIYFIMSEHIKGNNSKLEDSIKCTKCSHKVDNSYEFCPQCHEKLKETCQGCQRDVYKNWRYCPYCGDEGVED